MKTESRFTGLAPAIAILWAGVAIGATCIATPVKFLAPSLSLGTALEIGRVTFYWSGVAETLLCALFLLSLLSFGGVGWRWVAIPVVLFLVQRAGLMPTLDARTVKIISGQEVGESNLHTVYIYLELAKCLALLIIGFAAICMRRAGTYIRTETHPKIDGEEL